MRRPDCIDIPPFRRLSGCINPHRRRASGQPAIHQSIMSWRAVFLTVEATHDTASAQVRTRGCRQFRIRALVPGRGRRRSVGHASRRHTISSSVLPSPPAALARIIGAAGDPEVSLQTLGRLIEVDPVLSASVLGVTNSAACGMNRPVRSVSQAVVLLGLRALRNMAVIQAVRAVTERVDTGAFDTARFWEDSLRRATAALVIARRTGCQDPSEAFTVGLIQDLGCLAMAVQWPEQSEALQAAMDHTGARRLESERRLTGTTHPELFVTLGEDWGLSDELVDIIAGHHGAEPLSDRRDERLRSIASVADAVADVVQTDGNRSAIAFATRVLGDLDSREPLKLESVLEEVVVAMNETAATMQIRIGPQTSFHELMSRASEVLININASYEELTQRLQESNQHLQETNWQLQEALAEKRELARRLRSSNQGLHRLAATDVLTGVANRRAFITVLAQRLAAAQESGAWVSLLMMDIDHFKEVNDTYGHAAGDDVLKIVCQRLSKVIREPDLIGRLGGEEFAVLVAGADLELGRQVAERLRAAMSREPVQCRDGSRIPVTGSFGGVTVRGTVLPHPDDLLNRADQALYRAKETGRNRVTWHEAEPATPVAFGTGR